MCDDSKHDRIIFTIFSIGIVISLWSLTCLNIFLTYISLWFFLIWLIKLIIIYIDIVFTNIIVILSLLELSLLNFMTSMKHINHTTMNPYFIFGRRPQYVMRCFFMRKHHSQIIIIHSFAFGGRGYFSSTRPKFDQTCGYPGEGPKSREQKEFDSTLGKYVLT